MENLIVTENYPGAIIITRSVLMKKIISQLRKIAKTDIIVILYGESGTGKEALAKFIHANSNCCQDVFMPINCASIPSELLESELFGYEKGAFTGANREGKSGIFEVASTGTLYLDEIGEMLPSLQAKILRVLETGEFRRIGGGKIIRSNARIIAATNRNLEEMVDNHQFRADLYYRLNIVPIIIPPVRHRPEDIEPLAQFFLANLNQKYMTDKIFAPETIQRMKKYNWPGNVREIRNIVERLYITSDADILSGLTSPDIFPNRNPKIPIYENEVKKSDNNLPNGPDLDVPFKKAVRLYEKMYMQQMLEHCGGNTSLTAKMLQMSRAGFYKKWASLNK
jgi:transcriptional regulator with PAS, ATPase and Fis domain